MYVKRYYCVELNNLTYFKFQEILTKFRIVAKNELYLY